MTVPQASVAVANPVAAGSRSSPQPRARSGGQRMVGAVVSLSSNVWLHVTVVSNPASTNGAENVLTTVVGQLPKTTSLHCQSSTGVRVSHPMRPSSMLVVQHTSTTSGKPFTAAAVSASAMQPNWTSEGQFTSNRQATPSHPPKSGPSPPPEPPPPLPPPPLPPPPLSSSSQPGQLSPPETTVPSTNASLKSVSASTRSERDPSKGMQPPMTRSAVLITAPTVHPS